MLCPIADQIIDVELFTGDGTNLAEDLINQGFAISSRRIREDFQSRIPIEEEEKARADDEEKEDEAILRCGFS